MTEPIRALDEQDEPALLRDQFRQLLRYRTLLVTGVLLGLLGSGWLALSGEDTYAATGEVSVRSATSDPFAAGASADKGINIGSERQTAVVTTCYPTSPEETRARAARESSAYVYLVAHYGRSGTAPPAGHAALAPVVAGLRAHTNSPIAVGFGVSTRSHVAAVAASGADAAIVGSAGVARVEQALDEEGSVTTALRDFVRSLQPGPDETSKANTPIRTRS
ncbi:hypothetical protein GT034_22880 [Streptomyces sp. SID2563]|uniref:tryptophan synthase subunit alpha n=1 Tax=Streptomyces sp. SID2563 TaxID=2690255 RepID=UPI001368C532|nr:tryptophan synthase subunit alpha [Streptomyces sp. SID2563]MYW11172.1 hypothetical protein [Streptomyces sp. SID2563]